MLTKQEMFDRAVRGLRSQGFTQCGVEDYDGAADEVDEGDDNIHLVCQYTVGAKHCAWGWVDPSTTGEGSLGSLPVTSAVWNELDADGRNFARALQDAHDGCEGDPRRMIRSLQSVGERHGLRWPDLAEGL